jgi:antirestriction protein ArdC
VSDTIHQIVTDRMIAALQQGTVPWRKPWQAATGQPRSMSTGQPYRGINPFLLALTAAEQGYPSPYWGTYRQISDLGGQVRNGERSTLVVFWKQARAEQRDPQTGELAVKQPPVLRYYRVFNAAQADHLPGRFHPAPGGDTEIAQPQAVLEGYLVRGGPTLMHVAGDRADYHPGTDTIRLPARAQFAAPEGYYATAFHEAGHSTGHPGRLNRPGIAAFDHFGSGQYAREELTAQMTSTLLCAYTGLDDPATFANSASYIAGWLSALGNDHRLVITAAASAQRASDLITGPEHQPAQDSDRHAEPAPSPEEQAPAVTTAAAAGSSHANNRPGKHAVTAGEHGDRADQAPAPAKLPSPPRIQAVTSAAEPERATTSAREWQAEAG